MTLGVNWGAWTDGGTSAAGLGLLLGVELLLIVLAWRRPATLWTLLLIVLSFVPAVVAIERESVNVLAAVFGVVAGLLFVATYVVARRVRPAPWQLTDSWDEGYAP